MKRRWFTWHMNAYRLIVGVIVLAIVLPASVVGVPAMWLVALVCILVVLCAVVVGTPCAIVPGVVASLSDWSAPDRNPSLPPKGRPGGFNKRLKQPMGSFSRWRRPSGVTARPGDEVIALGEIGRWGHRATEHPGAGAFVLRGSARI